MERELYLPKPPGHPTAYAAGRRRSMTTAGSGTDCTVGDSAGSYGGTDRVSHAPGQWALESLQGAISLPSGELPQGPDGRSSRLGAEGIPGPDQLPVRIGQVAGTRAVLRHVSPVPSGVTRSQGTDGAIRRRFAIRQERTTLNGPTLDAICPLDHLDPFHLSDLRSPRPTNATKHHY